MDADRFAARASRGFEVLLGVVATLLGAAVLLFTAFGVYNAFGRPLQTPTVALAFLVALSLGLLLFFAGIRLVTGKHRSDGGLLSPWILRFGGVFFLFSPVALFMQLSWGAIFQVGVLVSAGIACFALANRREQVGADTNAPNNRWRGP